MASSIGKGNDTSEGEESWKTKTLSAEIRKLRKKLRQIDNLKRLDRDLVEEEEEKIAKAPSIRSLLRKKLKQLAELEKLSTQPQPCTDQSRDNPDEDTNRRLYRHDNEEVGGTLITDHAIANHPDVMKRNHDEIAADENRTPRSKAPDAIWNENSPQEGSPPKLSRHCDEALAKQVDSSSGQREITSAQGNVTSAQGNVTSAQRNVTSAQRNVTSAQRNITSAQGNITSVRAKQTSAQENASCFKGIPQTASPLTNSRNNGWSGSKFAMKDLDGHNDIVCAVSCVGSRMLTGSRDTMVKYWDIDSATELRSMGGHSGTVTAVVLLPEEESADIVSQCDLQANDCIAISGSKDCYIKVWSLGTGRTIHSIYTYSPVECLGYIGEKLLIASGTDGGKVELWDVTSGSNVFSIIGHEDAVMCMKIRNNDVYTASSDGVIKSWRLRNKALHTTFVSENILSQSTGRPLLKRHIRSLGVSREVIYYGDDGVNVKALQWETGSVHKLRNHSGEFGSTDAMCLTADLLVCAGYDLDDGCGYLNFWKLPEEQYLATLTGQDTSRIIAVDCTCTADGGLRVVTGGEQLQVWDRLPRNSSKNAVPVQIRSVFSLQARDSDNDSATDETSDSDGDSAPRQRLGSQGSDAPAKSSWVSWCTIV